MHSPTNFPAVSRDAFLARPTPIGAQRVTRGDVYFERYREDVLQRLGLHYAAEDLAKKEVERRVALVFQAASPEALDLLVADLPVPDPSTMQAGGARPSVVTQGVPERGVLAAVMGGSARKGPWVVPRYLKVVAIMGGAELDLRGARFAPGVTEIEVLAVMGGVDIIVPPGVRVETVGVAVMGAFEVTAGDLLPYDPDQPVLRISGFAAMGGVEARAKRPSTKALARFNEMVEKARKRGRKAG